MADSALLDVFVGGILGVSAVLGGSAITYYFTERSRSQVLIETMIQFGAQLIDALGDLMIYVADHQDKLSNLQMENWRVPPRSREELIQKLNDSLLVFPLPLPAEIGPTPNSPLSLQLEYNLKLVRRQVGEVNEMARELGERSTFNDEEVSRFLANVQPWTYPDIIEDLAVVIAGNLFGAVNKARGDFLSSWRAKRDLTSFRKDFHQDFENQLKVHKAKEERFGLFKKQLSKIKK